MLLSLNKSYRSHEVALPIRILADDESTWPAALTELLASRMSGLTAYHAHRRKIDRAMQDDVMLRIAPPPNPHQAIWDDTLRKTAVMASDLEIVGYPSDRQFWVDHGIGRRLCLWLEAIVRANPTAFAHQLLLDQRALRLNPARCFPYNAKSAGTAFRRACCELGISDLHFHDLRHEATSRLFEAGLTIEQVPLVTGHKDWKMLKRYTQLRPEGLHALLARASG